MAPDAVYVASRRALLDALDALGAQRGAVVLIGAQAVYLHAPDDDLAVAPTTTDTAKPYSGLMEPEPTSWPPGILPLSTSGAPVTSIKIIVEKHPDGYVAYPLGLSGAVVGQGDSYEAALADVRSAIAFHIETFGAEALELDSPVLEAFVAEAIVAG